MSATFITIVRRSKLAFGGALILLFCQPLRAELKNQCTVLFAAPANQISQKQTAIRIPHLTDRISRESLEEYHAAIAAFDTAAPGTPIDFGSGHEFVLDKVLGEGGTTIIIKTQDQKVLRINKRAVDAMPGTDLATFVKLQAELEADGVPVVKVDLTDSLLPSYLHVEEKKIVMTLDDLNRNGSRVPLTNAEMKLARERFFEFARKTWKYTYVGDFSGSQLGYDGESWFLFDLGKVNARLKNHREQRNIFSRFDIEGTYLRFVSEELENQLAELIKRERNLHFKNGDWQDTEEPVYFARAASVDTEYDLIVGDDSYMPGYSALNGARGKPGDMHRISAIPKKFLANSIQDKFKFKLFTRSSGKKVVPLEFKQLVEVGATSALYRVLIDGEKKALVEIPYTIKSKKDLFRADHPLLKARGVKTRDLDAIGPDYVMVMKK